MSSRLEFRGTISGCAIPVALGVLRGVWLVYPVPVFAGNNRIDAEPAQEPSDGAMKENSVSPAQRTEEFLGHGTALTTAVMSDGNVLYIDPAHRSFWVEDETAMVHYSGFFDWTEESELSETAAVVVLYDTSEDESKTYLFHTIDGDQEHPEFIWTDQQGNAVYHFVPGDASGKRGSGTTIELQNSPHTATPGSLNNDPPSTECSHQFHTCQITATLVEIFCLLSTPLACGIHRREMVGEEYDTCYNRCFERWLRGCTRAGIQLHNRCLDEFDECTGFGEQPPSTQPTSPVVPSTD